jgi:hypothetical protein
VLSATFSPDGTDVVTSVDRAAYVWDVRTVGGTELKGLLDLAELVAGGKMRGLRDFVPSGKDPNPGLQAWRERARGWANAPDGSFEQWVHWYFADPATRPDQPGLWRGATTR